MKTNAKTLTNQIAGAFKKLFLKRSVNSSARRTKFTKRKPKKLDGFSFLVAMTVARFKKSG